MLLCIRIQQARRFLLYSFPKFWNELGIIIIQRKGTTFKIAFIGKLFDTISDAVNLYLQSTQCCHNPAPPCHSQLKYKSLHPYPPQCAVATLYSYFYSLYLIQSYCTIILNTGLERKYDPGNICGPTSNTVPSKQY